MFKTQCRNILCWFLLLTGIFGLAPVEGWAQISVWDGTFCQIKRGTGKANDPFVIKTASEFAYMMQALTEHPEQLRHKHFRLAADIDMADINWNYSIATKPETTFCGVFDGTGHKICHLLIELNDSPRETHVGLFPQLGGDEQFETVVKNLEIDGMIVMPTVSEHEANMNFRVGGIAGQQYANSLIENCIVRGLLVTDLYEQITLPGTSRIHAHPLVGEVLSKFGEEKGKTKTARTLASYGSGEVYLDNIVGTKKQFDISLEQGVQPSDEEYEYSYNGLTWYELSAKNYSFLSIDAEILALSGIDEDKYEISFDRRPGHYYTFEWYADNQLLTRGDIPTATILPGPKRQTLKVKIFDGGRLAYTASKYIEPEHYGLLVTKEEHMAGKYQLEVSVQRQNCELVDVGNFDISWIDANEGFREVAQGPVFNNAEEGKTYLITAKHHEQEESFSLIHSYGNTVFVCHNGISEEEAAQYTTNGKSYPIGDDSNDGKTPETAIRTIKRAFDILRQAPDHAKMANNVIVIMGNYDENVVSLYLDADRKIANPNYSLTDIPVMATGSYGAMRNGRLLLAGQSILLKEDIQLEELTLYGLPDASKQATSNLCEIDANGHKLVMGHGISRVGYRSLPHEHRKESSNEYEPYFIIYNK